MGKRANFRMEFDSVPTSWFSRRNDFQVIIGNRAIYSFKAGQQRDVHDLLDPYMGTGFEQGCEHAYIFITGAAYANLQFHLRRYETEDTAYLMTELDKICDSKILLCETDEKFEFIFAGEWRFEINAKLKDILAEILKDATVQTNKTCNCYGPYEIISDDIIWQHFENTDYPICRQIKHCVYQEIRELLMLG